MIRSYLINLLFINDKDNPLKDTEGNIWYRYKNNTKVVNTNWQITKAWDFSNNTMLLNKSGHHIRLNENIEIKSRLYTLSFKYKVERNFMFRAMIDEERLPCVEWDSGNITLLDYDSMNTSCITVKLLDYTYYIPTELVLLDDWNHFLMCIDEDRIFRIFLNGNKVKEKYIVSPSYHFNNLKIGNLEIKKNITDGPVIELDEIVLVNDCLYKESFDVPNTRLHQLFPEVVIEDKIKPIIIKHSNGNTPYIFNSKKSLNDTVHNMEITRRRDYKPKSLKEVRNLQISKYKFDNDNDILNYLERGE